MKEFIHFIPESKLRDAAVKQLAESGRLNQSFLYMTEGASSFYRYRNSDLAKMQSAHEFAFFQENGLFTADGSTAVISLGCGNGGAEAELLKTAVQNGVCPAYFGIDSSSEMLKLAALNMEQLCVSPRLILGDFSAPDFAEKLSPLLARHLPVIYLLMGGTFGNVPQKPFISHLSSLIKKDAYFYLDVVPLSRDADFEALKQRFSRLHENYEHFFSQILTRLTIPIDAGRIYSEEKLEDHPSALRTRFFFKSRADLQLRFLNTTIPLKKGTDIELLTIRAYEIDSLNAFIEEYGFQTLSQFHPSTGSMKHGWQRLLFKNPLIRPGKYYCVNQNYLLSCIK